ncbi:MAG: hypothetical protein M3163_13120 [Actinomycetota bacterium]|nr:hypothetical protein [Actinomycetota bacterium]
MNRDGPVKRAVAGSILVNIVVALAVFLPGVSDDVPGDAKVMCIVTAAIAALGAWGLWNRRTSGHRTTLVLTVLNVLSTVHTSSTRSAAPSWPWLWSPPH